MQYPKTTTPEIAESADAQFDRTKIPDLSSYVEQQGRFHSEKDQAIAANLALRLSAGLRDGYIGPDAHAAATESLMALIPTENSSSRRQIDGHTINPALEQRIASRLLGKEIDIAAPDGPWGRLPETVKKYTTYYGSDMRIEMASHCTVGCGFCAVANKGAIKTKASFDSAIEVIRDFTSRQAIDPTQTRSDILYWGSDPFDLKWAATDATPERDYSDLAEAYASLPSTRSRKLFTSTAVPVGEELRIIDFIDKSIWPTNYNIDFIRLSKTRANARRVEHIQTILQALNPHAANKLIINNVAEHIALRGDRWHSNDRNIVLWDIIGPNCRDGVIIGVNSVDGIVMQGASPERPSGETRTPIETTVDSKRIYTVPRHYASRTLEGYDNLSDIYPNTWVSTITIDNNGAETIAEQEINDDPHRALLRLAGVIRHYMYIRGRGQMDPTAIAQEFNAHFGKTVRTIEGHAAGNWVMAAILRLAANEGLIQPTQD